ncbi:MAG: Cj0069 family protein [Planctomycetota bacterium]|nr:Cj0069 family protein [Planctomycetota bacterium]
MLHQRILFMEAEGGTDKWLDGHRRDTQPIVFALKTFGWDAEVLYYRDEWKDQIIEHATGRFDAYVSRVNPGNLKNGEAQYFETLRELTNRGLLGMSHPDAMQSFGAKDALVKLVESDFVPDDTYAYYTVEEFRAQFPKSLAGGERVLKQNRGSTGSGIWRVHVEDRSVVAEGEALPLTTWVKCTEAVDNHVEFHQLGDFMTFCEQYIVGENGMLVDMRFLPRIREGEVRLLMVGNQPIFVVHKKPADGEDSFSATLFSGAVYTYDKPELWSGLVDKFLEQLPSIRERLGGHDTPLIWTADFILDWDENGDDTYILGEFNCSCVGFTSHLDQGIQEKVAKEIIRLVESRKPVPEPAGSA